VCESSNVSRTAAISSVAVSIESVLASISLPSRGFLFREEGLPIDGRIGPANMVKFGSCTELYVVQTARGTATVRLAGVLVVWPK
jgi:hypothetical protein